MRPAWNDEHTLIDYVAQALGDLGCGSIISVPATGPTDAAAHAVLNERRDQERKAALARYGLAKSPFESNPLHAEATWKELEGERVALAKSGNYKPLFDLLLLPAARAALQESTWRLIVAIGTGKHKRPNNAPKQTDAERFNRTPVHRAAYLFPVVTRLLLAWYPKQTTANINNRALEIAARIHQIEPETVNNYLRRSKRGRHRLSD